MKRALVVLLLAVACDSDPIAPDRCGRIPEGGCPDRSKDACSDPACSAVYTCSLDGRWTLDRACAPRADAGLVQDASVVDAPVRDVSIDAPPGAFGGPGCSALEEPDCPLGLALACDQACCGCEDLFVCEKGGWTLWGSCGDAGIRSLSSP